MGAELVSVKDRLRHLLRLHIGQFPLPRRLRDLPTHVAVDRIAGQHDFRAALVFDNGIKDARVMIVEIPKTAQSILLPPDRRQ